MPTKHRRIAVVVDPELSEALEVASLRFPGRSSASLVRKLAMLGADAVERSAEPKSKLERLLARPGVRPPRGDLREYLQSRPPLAAIDPDDPNGLSRALDEQREERLP